MSTAVSNEIRRHFNLQDHEQVWREEPPEKIIFATASVRKAVLFSWALHNFSFDHIKESGFVINGPGLENVSTPEEIQEYFNTYIYNGDMALKEPVLLGEFEGVPVWAYPQTDETEDNEDPVAESIHKVTKFGKLFEGKKVLVIASDVVGTSSAFTQVDRIIKMGKPVNFKKKFQEENVQTQWDPDSERSFITWYKEVIFAIGAQLGHVSGIAVLDTQDKILYTAQLELIQHITAQLHEHLEVYMDAGLGGAWQQIQHYFNDTISLLADAVTDIVPSEVIAQAKDDPEHESCLRLEQYAFTHMVGVQVLAFLEILVGTQRKETEFLAATHGYEVLLFSQERSKTDATPI